MAMLQSQRLVEIAAKLMQQQQFQEYLDAVRKQLETDTAALINDPDPVRAGRCQAWRQIITETEEACIAMKLRYNSTQIK